MGDQHCQAQGLTPIFVKQGGLIWVYHDFFFKDEQWTIVIFRKKQKMKNLNYHVISFIGNDNDTSASLLIDSENEQIIMMEDQALAGSTRLKNHISSNMIRKIPPTSNWVLLRIHFLPRQYLNLL